MRLKEALKIVPMYKRSMQRLKEALKVVPMYKRSMQRLKVN